MVENFGSYLKAERELRGVTLEELHAKTKIPIHFLKALEKSQLEKLPEEVFIRGYIRSFAKVIGANEDEMLSAYIDITKTSSTDFDNQSSSNQSSSNQSSSSEDNSSLNIKFIFILIFIVLFLAGTAWGLNILIRKINIDSTKSSSTVLQQTNKIKENLVKGLPNQNLVADDTPTPLTVSELDTKNLAIDPALTIQTSPISLTTKSNLDFENSSDKAMNEDTEEKLKLESSKTQTVSAEDGLSLKLTIKVKNDVWFNIAVDDFPVEDFVVARGTEKIFYGGKQYLLTVGNQNSIDLTLNDIAVSFPSENKEDIVKNFTITSKLIE